MTIDRASCLEPCATEGGNLVGRDPRQMGRIGLEAAGFEAMTPMEVIRAKCLDCCADSAQEVRYCVSVNCPNWPYRMGSNPFRPPMSEERKAASRAALAKGRATLSKPPTSPDSRKAGQVPVPGTPKRGDGVKSAAVGGVARLARVRP